MLGWILQRAATAAPRRVLPGWVRGAWWLSLPACLAVALLWGLAVQGPLDGDFTVAHLAYRVLPPACAQWGAATVGLCIAVQALAARAVTAGRAEG